MNIDNLHGKNKILFLIGALLSILGVFLKIFEAIFGSQSVVAINIFSILLCLIGAFLVGYSIGNSKK